MANDAFDSLVTAVEALQTASEGDTLTALEAIQTALEAIQATQESGGDALTALEAIQTAVEADRKPSGLPSDAAPVAGINGTDITEAVAVDILAPSSGTLALYLSRLQIYNETVGEDPVITLQDESPNVTVWKGMPSTNGGNAGYVLLTFDPPIKLTTGEKLQGIASGSLGDTKVIASGWEGTPPA